MKKRKKQPKKKIRQSIYKYSFIFTLIYFTLIYFQKRILSGLFQTQLSFSIPDTIAILTSSHALDELTTRGTNGAILVGVFLIIEVLIFISAIIYFLIKLWKVHSSKYWKKYDYTLVLGLLVLLIGSFYYAFVTANTSLETFTTIQNALNHLGPKQLGQLGDKWKNFIYHYEFSLGYLPRDISIVIDQVKTIVSSVKEIAQLPDVINGWLNQLSLFKFHYFLVICSGSFLVILAQLFESRKIWNRYFKFNFKKKEPKIRTEDLLQDMKEEQQLLIGQIYTYQENAAKEEQKKARSKNYHRKR